MKVLKTVARLSLVCYNVALFYFTLAPPAAIGEIPAVGGIALDLARFRGGVVIHYFMILGLFGFWFANVVNDSGALWASLLTGVVLEAIQLAIPWRTFSLQDLLANLAGGLTGYAVASYLARSGRLGRLASLLTST